MLALTGANVAGVAAFALLYALAGHRLLSPATFQGALALLFLASAVLWVRPESRQGPRRDVLSRAGRIAMGIALPVVATPVVVLTPLFFLLDQLPRETGMADTIGRVMFLLLASLALVVLVNAAGMAFMGAATLWRWWRRPRNRPVQ